MYGYIEFFSMYSYGYGCIFWYKENLVSKHNNDCYNTFNNAFGIK